MSVDTDVKNTIDILCKDVPEDQRSEAMRIFDEAYQEHRRSKDPNALTENEVFHDSARVYAIGILNNYLNSQ